MQPSPSIIPIFRSKALMFCLFGLCSAATVLGGDTHPQLALIPLANHTTSLDAQKMAMTKLKQKLVERGFRLVDADTLRNLMRAERLRLIGAIDSASADLIAAHTGAAVVLTGSLDLYFDQENPEVGISLHAYDCREHQLIWAASEATTGEDQAGLFGIGRVSDAEELLNTIIDKIAAAVPDLGGELATPKQVEKRDRRLAALGRIAVFPIDNSTDFAGAGPLATNVLIQELHERGYDVLPVGEISQLQSRLMVDLSVGVADTALVLLSQRYSVAAVVTGIVTKFVNIRSSETEIMPEFEISLRLIDPASGNVAASVSLGKSGSDSETLFGAGRVYSVGQLTQRTVAAGWKMLVKQWNERTPPATTGSIQREEEHAQY